jgi:hypothetical protein
MECPVCGEDRTRPVSEATRHLIRVAGLIGEMCNPGGRELQFRNKGRLQLADQCGPCDERRILTFLQTGTRST